MNFRWISDRILTEISSILNQADEEKVLKLVEAILSSERIFLTGLGRSGLVARSFAIRLMHLGFKVLIVGEVTTPAIKKGDLLVAISGSGETAIVKHIVSKAKELGAVIFLITSKTNTSIGEISDQVLILPEIEKPVLPLKSAFEAVTYILLDATIVMIMQKTGVTSQEMMERHSNLE
ncbi:MAG: 6-phospho-3-hexuloisomerase [Candidatus Poribacteria bacterium]|nr:6-phospho-3-hexuloisomerase [Candidatus Poribacteria bacterium]